MITFDLEKAEQGDWFSFFDSTVDPSTGEITYHSPEPDAPEFCIRSMSPFYEERRRLRKKVSTMAVNPVTRVMERVTSPEVQSFEEDWQEAQDGWDYAIVDFRKVPLPDGTLLECNRETKLKLIRIPKVMRFMQRVFQVLDGEASKVKEGTEKNSLTGLSGK